MPCRASINLLPDANAACSDLTSISCRLLQQLDICFSSWFCISTQILMDTTLTSRAEPLVYVTTESNCVGSCSSLNPYPVIGPMHCTWIQTKSLYVVYCRPVHIKHFKSFRVDGGTRLRVKWGEYLNQQPEHLPQLIDNIKVDAVKVFHFLSLEKSKTEPASDRRGGSFESGALFPNFPSLPSRSTFLFLGSTPILHVMMKPLLLIFDCRGSVCYILEIIIPRLALQSHGRFFLLLFRRWCKWCSVLLSSLVTLPSLPLTDCLGTKISASPLRRKLVRKKIVMLL